MLKRNKNKELSVVVVVVVVSLMWNSLSLLVNLINVSYGSNTYLSDYGAQSVMVNYLEDKRDALNLKTIEFCHEMTDKDQLRSSAGPQSIETSDQWYSPPL